MNAEAARGTFMEIANVNQSVTADRYFDYYDALYALNFRDIDRVQDLSGDYVAKYGSDLNIESVRATAALFSLDIASFYSIMVNMYDTYDSNLVDNSSLRLTFQ